MSVFVVGLNGCRLMPTSERKARLLLKQGKAFVEQKVPFTIRLNYKTGSTTQLGYLGIDTGSQHIGVSVVREDGTVLHKEEIGLRDSMSKRKLLEAKASLRRGRRYRKTRYRHPKWRPKTKRVYCEVPDRKGRHWQKKKITFTSKRPKGWLPPSLQSKTDHHIRWIKKLQDLLPKGYRLSIELGRFDPARMKNPEIHGDLYQKGPQYDYENVRAYVLDRDRYTCQICKKKGGKLHVHHILYRSHGATDDPQYMVTVCSDCHSAQNHLPGGILYQWMQEQKRFSRGLRDATFMNILRKRLIRAFPEAVFTYGNVTKVDREKLKLPKSHGNDATAIALVKTGITAVKDKESVICIQQVRRKKRSLHEETPRKGRKEPNRTAARNNKNTKAVTVTKRQNKKKVSMTGCLFDRVELNGKKGWISGFTGKSCSFKTQNSASLWQLDHRSKENFREGVMAQRAILLSSRSLNGREFPQSILKFLTATEEEAKQYLMDCIDNDIKENMNLNEIANNLNIFNVKENSFCMLKNDSDYLSQDVLTSGVRRIADRNH